jgi:hypothetical protein
MRIGFRSDRHERTSQQTFASFEIAIVQRGHTRPAQRLANQARATAISTSEVSAIVTTAIVVSPALISAAVVSQPGGAATTDASVSAAATNATEFGVRSAHGRQFARAVETARRGADLTHRQVKAPERD